MVRLLCCCFAAASLLLCCCFAAVVLLCWCCFAATAVVLLLYCCCAALLLLLWCCCFTAAVLLLCCCCAAAVLLLCDSSCNLGVEFVAAFWQLTASFHRFLSWSQQFWKSLQEEYHGFSVLSFARVAGCSKYAKNLRNAEPEAAMFTCIADRGFKFLEVKL